MDSISIDNTISKEAGQEAMSLTYASLKDAAGRQEDSITTERLQKNNTILDTYTIVSDPISGGMGSVWQVHHNGWNLDLAMKRPKPRYFAEGGAERKKNFLRECENWISLGLHPNIVSCYYVREISGVPSVFSEWMDGGSLKDRIRDGSLYTGAEEEVQERILDIAIQSARGLMYSHNNGLLHLDVKPGNLLLTKAWDTKAADFGLAGQNLINDLTNDPRGRFLSGCTPEYCPQEQANGEKPARWMDVYAWALTVLEMYAGERYWKKGAEAADRCESYLERCSRDIPESMRRLIAHCITDKPDGFKEVLEYLEQIYKEVTGHKYPRKYPEKAASDTADSLNNRALSYLDLGMPEEAEKLWEEALLYEPDHADTLFNRELHLLRTSRKTDTQAMAVLNNFETTKAISAADMIALECGGSYIAGDSEYSWKCPEDEEIRIGKICPEAAYAFTIAIYDRHTLTGLRIVPVDNKPSSQNTAEPSVNTEKLDPLDEIREKEYELWPWSSELEKHVRPKKATRIDFMDIHPGKGLAAFKIFDTVCLYSLDERKIIGEAKPEVVNPNDAFRFNPEGTRLVMCGTGKNWGAETFMLEIPSMKTVLDEHARFVGFLTGEKTLLRRTAEENCLIEADADGSPRVLYRFEKPLEECHEFVGAQEPFLCYRYKSSEEAFRLDSGFRAVKISNLFFDAAQKVCFYDPDQQLVCIDRNNLEVWDVQSGSFLYSSVYGLGNYQWDESRQAFLTFCDHRFDLLWKWSPMPCRNENARPAQWMVSHILTSQKRTSEDERIHAMLEEFERASDDDTERCIEIYHEARKIEGFSFSEEADYMTQWLDEYAERTGILAAQSLGILDDIPAVSENVFEVWKCNNGLRALYSSYNKKQIVIFDEDGELVREIPVPSDKAVVRGAAIYVFMEPMQWAVYDLRGNQLRTPEAGWPPKWVRSKADRIYYGYRDMNSTGKLTLFTVVDKNDPAIGGTFLLEMDTGKVRRLTDGTGYAAFLKDDTVIRVSENSIYRYDPSDGRLIKKAPIPKEVISKELSSKEQTAPQNNSIYDFRMSQERDKFYIRITRCTLIYDMNCALIGRCDTYGNELHWLPGGRFIKDGQRIWNVLENKIEIVIKSPGVLKDSQFRRITASPDGREIYAEKYKAYETGEVTAFRLEYDYSPGKDEASEPELLQKRELPENTENKTKRAGFFASLFRRNKPSPQNRADETDPLAEENSKLRESRRMHVSEDKKLEKFLQNPLKYPPIKEYKEPDRRRPAGSRPHVALADQIIRMKDLDDKSRLMVKVRVNDIECLNNPAVSECFGRIADKLGESGRILVKRSGIIPEIATLIEADTDTACIKYMNQFLDALWEEGFME